MSDNLGTAVLELTADDSRLNKSIDSAHRNVQQGMSKIGGQLQGVGKKLTMGLTLPIVGFGVASAKVAGDFEEQMNILTLAARESGTSLEQLQDAAIATGADTELVGISAAQAADAMTNFYKAGLTTSDIFGGKDGMNAYLNEGASLTGVLRSAVDLAAASELDLAAASDAVSIAMKTFGYKAEDATKIANNFVQTADASVASVGELVDAMANVGPTMAAFGIPLEDVNVGLAILSERGIKGSEAGTALKSMMTNVMRETDKVTEALGDLNLSLYDQAGNMKSLPTIVGELGTAMSGLTEEQRNYYVQTLFGTYGMKAAQTLLAEGAEGWDAMTVKINAAATAEESAAARTKGLNAVMEQLQGAVETLMIKAFLPFVQRNIVPLVKRFGELIEKITTVNPEFFDMAIKVGLVLAAVGPLLTVVGLMLPAIGALLSPVGLVIAALVLLGAAFVKSSGGIGPAIEKIKGLVSTIMEKLEPVLLYIRGLWDDLWPQMQETITVALDKIEKLWTWLWPHMQKILAGTWKEIKIVIETGIKIMQGLLKTVMVLIRGDWKGAWEGIKSVAQALWDGIKALIKTRIGMIRDLLGINLGKIESKWSGVWGRVKELVENVFNKVVPFVKGMLNSMRNFFTKQMDTIKAWVDDNMPLIQETFETILTAIKKVWDWVWERVLEKIIGVLDDIKVLWEWIWPYLQTYVLGVWDGIKIIIETAIRAVLGIIKAIMLLINGDWEEAWEEIEGVADTIWTGIKTLIESWIGMILALLGTNMADIKTAWETTWGNIQAFVETTWTNIKTWIETTIGDIIAFATTNAQAVWDAFTAPFQALWDFLFDTATGIFPDLLAKIGGWKDAIITLFQKAKDLLEDAMTAPFEAAKQVISGIFDKIKGWWNKIQFWKKNADTGGGGGSEPAGDSGVGDPAPAPEPSTPKTRWDADGNYIGWYAKGLDAIFNTPTLIGVGEAGRERVTVTPLRGAMAGAGGGGTVVNNLYYSATRPATGRADAAQAFQELELYARLR